MTSERLHLEDYFIRTGFYDLLPLANNIAEGHGFCREEMTEAICKVFDKSQLFPPTKNRTAWFCMVFKEKLYEAMGDILAYKGGKKIKIAQFNGQTG